MANTGKKIYPFLRQMNGAVPTGLRKANVEGDADYVAPVIDYTLCPIQAWRAINPVCLTAKQCAPGYILSPDELSCILIEEQPATVPSGSGGTPGVAVKLNNAEWNNGGAIVFNAGYAVGGTGSLAATFTTPHLWVNGNAPFDTPSRNAIDSRMNYAGVWVTPTVPINEWIGFVRKITTSVVKTVFVGICADNAFKLTLNGTILVNTDTTNGGPNFNFMNIFPVTLPAGDNYIEMYARNYGSAAGMAMEIYDCTFGQLSAVTNNAQLDAYTIFSTKNMVGENLDLGITLGWSCPVGWYLVQTAPGTYVCRKNTTAAPSTVNTGQKGYANRERLTNGVADGYSEPNLNGTGLGPYYPPVLDLINCPI